MFIEKSLKRPMYRLYKRDGKYYIGNSKKPLSKDHYVIKGGWHKILIYRNNRYARKFMSNMTNTPGTYGIFVRSNRGKYNIGECLYVGQSSDVKRRMQQHKDSLKFARHELILNHGEIPRYEDRFVSTMYYRIASQYTLKELKFVKLMSISRKEWFSLNKKDAFELLTLLEQYSMDCWKPKYNLIAARVTQFN